MKRNSQLRPVALAALIAAAALPINPAFAQEVAPAVAPPVVQTTVPDPAPPAPAATAPARVFAPRQDVVQPVPPRPAPPLEVAVPEPAAIAKQPRPAATRATQRASRAAPRPVPMAPRSAPIQAASVAAPESSAVSEVSTPVTPQPVAVAPAPAAPLPSAASAEPQGNTPWLWIAVAFGAAVALLGVLFARRRRSERNFGYGRPTYVPVDETGAPVPEVDLDERPWIRLTLQPKHAESRGGEQTVDYELIVENEGQVPAHDVRVSSFLTGLKGTSIVATLGNSQTQTHHIDVEPGESVSLPGKVTVRDGIDPKIVADARYLLPDGSEGHLAARFGIDMSTPEAAAQVEDVLERV